MKSRRKSHQEAQESACEAIGAKQPGSRAARGNRAGLILGGKPFLQYKFDGSLRSIDHRRSRASLRRSHRRAFISDLIWRHFIGTPLVRRRHDDQSSEASRFE
jgi:hypothetical protein